MDPSRFWEARVDILRPLGLRINYAEFVAPSENGVVIETVDPG